jgi:cation diffusion facilitator family transporter
MMTSAIRVTLITALSTALLAVAKLGAGHYGQSHALFADGLHSLSDVVIDIIVIFASHYGAKQADFNHPYGHGRIETAATLGLALILFLAGIGIIWDAGKHVWGGKPAPTPDLYVLWVAVLAIILNEALFRYTLAVAKKIKSQLLQANAWHSRSDAAVSLVVLLGIGGAMIGFPRLDAVGAIFVGIMIGKMGGMLVWKSLSELVDTGVEKETLERIQEVITKIAGVKTLHQLRTRTVNNAILIDVHILVSSYISVSEGHFIGDQVIIALKKLPDIADITVHVDPEDDETAHPSSNLPAREEVIQMIKNHCSDLPVPEKILLHYLNGKLEIEITLPLSVREMFLPKDISKYYHEALNHLDAIRKISVIFST